ncbi:MAG: thioredoxin [Candidatus Pacearchaeota archaeon]
MNIIRGEGKMTQNDKVPELTNGEFEDFTKKDIVLVDFFAEWCMPCLMMAPVIDELAEKFRGKIKFGKVNVEDNQEIARKFKISSIPNFVLMKNGKVIDNFIGAVPQEELEKRLRKYL